MEELQQLVEDGPVADPRAVAARRVGWLVDGRCASSAANWSHKGSVSHDGKAGIGLPVITERRTAHDHQALSLFLSRGATSRLSARPLTPGEKPNRKLMATVACVFDTPAAPRRPHDVIHPPGGRSGERPACPGPRAENQWCDDSLVRSPEQVA